MAGNGLTVVAHDRPSVIDPGLGQSRLGSSTILEVQEPIIAVRIGHPGALMRPVDLGRSLLQGILCSQGP